LSSTCPKLLPPLSFIMMSRERAISAPGKSRSAKWSLGEAAGRIAGRKRRAGHLHAGHGGRCEWSIPGMSGIAPS
jgi:hypothetical protein